MDMRSYDRFTDRVRLRPEQDERVIALIALGSTADPDRRDQWSDHDFWLITEQDVWERYLEPSEWLPDAEHIVLAFRQGSSYATVLYRDGRQVEFGVFDSVHMLHGRLDRFAVLFDKRGAVTDMCRDLAARSWATVDQEAATASDLELLSHFYLQIATGVQRHARGEMFSGDYLIRCQAVLNVLALVARHLEPERPILRDGFDVRRHFEAMYPEVSVAIREAVSQPVPGMAQSLVAIVEHELAPRIAGFPEGVSAVVRELIVSQRGRG